MGKGAGSQAVFEFLVFFCVGWTALFGYFFFVALGRTLYDPSAYLEATCTLRGGNETSMTFMSSRENSYALYVNLAVTVSPKDPARANFTASGNNCGMTDWANDCGTGEDKFTWATCNRDPWCDVSVAVPKECIDDKTEPCPRWRNESTLATFWCSKPCVKDQCSNHTLPIGRSFACWYDGERNFDTTPSEWPAKYVGGFDAARVGVPLGVRFMAPTVECDYSGKDWSAMTVFWLIGFVCGALPLGCLLLLLLGLVGAGLFKCLLGLTRSLKPTPARKASGEDTGVVLHDIEQD